MELKYDIEADWLILTSCNFRCEYCLVSSSLLCSKITVYGQHAQWLEGFNATKKTWLLHITGGEPFIYPGFTELCEQLVREHYLSINTNLAHDCVDSFAEKINPQRVHFINAGLHFDERKKRAGLNAFVGRVQKLQQHGFNVLVSVLITPKMVSMFPDLVTYFSSFGINLIPKTMRGTHEGKTYPIAYSEAEKSSIIRYLKQAREDYRPIIARMGEPATIDMFSDHRFLDRSENYRGRWCGSGYNFVRINPDGTVLLCHSGKRLGNILEKCIKLSRSPSPCKSSYCPYFCEKYTSPQFAQRQPRTTAASLVRSLSDLVRNLLRS